MSTPKAHALGAALAGVRTEQQVSQRELAARLGLNHSTIARWESGSRSPSPEDLGRLLAALAVDEARAAEIGAMARTLDEPRWLAATLPEQRAQLDALVDIESTATAIVDVSPLIVPGLLQTRDYARAVIDGGSVPPGERATRVLIRLGRQAIVTRDDDPVRLLALIGEAAIRQVVGTPAVTAGQLRRLLEIMTRPNVDLRVVPFRAGPHPAMEGPFMLLTTPEVEGVYLENRLSGLFLHRETDVAEYREAVAMVQEVALSAGESADLMTAVLAELTAASEGT
jgi:transcriptional regulator with XRE-family HTH domain